MTRQRKLEPHLPLEAAEVTPDKALIDKLRKNFSHKLVAEELLNIIKELCAAIGVKINTQIVEIDEKHKVDTNVVMGGIPRLSSIVAAVYAGSAINPLHLIEEHQNVTKQPWKQADREAPPNVDAG